MILGRYLDKDTKLFIGVLTGVGGSGQRYYAEHDIRQCGQTAPVKQAVGILWDFGRRCLYLQRRPKGLCLVLLEY